MPHDRRQPLRSHEPGRVHVKLDGLTLETRFPRLIHAMQWVAILSHGEATSCLQDYLSRRPYSGEAVDHFGGTKAVIRAAARANVRSIVADQRRYTTTAPWARKNLARKGLR